jgi:pilus assembly protein Flp/PilA
MYGKLKEFFKDESGQTSTEYILLVAVVAMIVFKFRETAGEKLDNLTKSIFEKAEQNILTQLGN